MDYLFLDFTTYYNKSTLSGKHANPLPVQIKVAEILFGEDGNTVPADFIRRFFIKGESKKYYLGRYSKQDGIGYGYIVRAGMTDKNAVATDKDLVLIGEIKNLPMVVEGRRLTLLSIAVTGIDTIAADMPLEPFTQVECRATCGFPSNPGGTSTKYAFVPKDLASVLTIEMMQTFPVLSRMEQKGLVWNESAFSKYRRSKAEEQDSGSSDRPADEGDSYIDQPWFLKYRQKIWDRRNNCYLFLNCKDSMSKVSKSNDSSVYDTSLMSQLEALKKKLSIDEPFMQFMRELFPSQMWRSYYVYLPNFDRKLVTKAGTDEQKLSNIVIRVPSGQRGPCPVPPQYDMIIIGDLVFDGIFSIDVKGMEAIDHDSARKKGEICIACRATCMFANSNQYEAVQGSVLPEGVFYNDLLNDMIPKLSLIMPKNGEDPVDTMDKWDEYLDFRKYYLSVMSQHHYAIDSVMACDSYRISKSTYQKSKGNMRDSYDLHILDEADEFKGRRSDDIILDSQVGDASEFPLIRVEITKKKCELEAEINPRTHKPEFESDLRRWVKDSVCLASQVPEYDDDGNIKGKTVQSNLGKRYKITTKDIEPDYSELEDEYEENLRLKNSDIDTKWDGVIKNELDKDAAAHKKDLKASNDLKLKEYCDGLEASLEEDAEENQDSNVKVRASNLAKEKFTQLASGMQQRVGEIDKEISRLSGQGKQKSGRKNSKKNKNKSKNKGVEPSEDIADLEADEKAAALTKRLDDLKKEREDLVSRIAEASREAEASVDIIQLYRDRNAGLVSAEAAGLDALLASGMEDYRKRRKTELAVQYDPDRKADKQKAENDLNAELAQSKDKLKMEETVRLYRIYFRPADEMTAYETVRKRLEGLDLKYLIYDNRAEKKKLERQENAIRSLRAGDLRNPYLASYLFDPASLPAVAPGKQDLKWYLDSLNDRQKEAVQHALRSNSIFLLQGPPGTGKTQVIAELTAHLVKEGKKVLISSETHKAIDNVFDRLPPIPEIRPLRLIPSTTKKETSYSPERLVPNLYINIAASLRDTIGEIESRTEKKEAYSDSIKQLRFDYRKYLEARKQSEEQQSESRKTKRRLNDIDDEIASKKDELAGENRDAEECKRTISCIDRCQFEDAEDRKMDYINEYLTDLKGIIKNYDSLKSVGPEHFSELANADLDALKEEISALNGSYAAALTQKREALMQRMFSLMVVSPSEGMVPPKKGAPGYEDYQNCQKELIAITNEIDNSDPNGVDVSSTQIYRIAPSIIGDSDLLQRFPEELKRFREEQKKAADSVKRKIRDEQKTHEDKAESAGSEINSLKMEKNELNDKLTTIENSSDMQDYYKLDESLKQKISSFFEDKYFGIAEDYPSGDYERAIDIIEARWKEFESEFSQGVEDNKGRISAYRGICSYIENEDVQEMDKPKYTSDLYACANVFGITCTSRDRYLADRQGELAALGIGDIDIKKQGIDVVILDEVSKSSFVDLLIPMMYGKTVVLVGDHRQLPPMYDLRYLKGSDFENLDPDIITEDLNKRYQKMFETCFFKTMFEAVPEEYKIMLNVQYRFHSQIMQIVNHFYGGNDKDDPYSLKCPSSQDDKRGHGLQVEMNGNVIISPEHHVYFVDCDGNEASDEGSTSIYNEQESDVAVALLDSLKDAADAREGDKLSAGVICTYGDQARKIWNRIVKGKIRRSLDETFSTDKDEKLIVSTVDDFQGDERDIIIVSMVRNPKGGNDPSFIKQFERINVAFSRARRLLIILGSEKFLSKQSIDLPDVMGREGKDKPHYRIYAEIIKTIRENDLGRVIPASDILGGGYDRG